MTKRNQGAGGANTNKNGLPFEELCSIPKLFNEQYKIGLMEGTKGNLAKNIHLITSGSKKLTHLNLRILVFRRDYLSFTNKQKL